MTETSAPVSYNHSDEILWQETLTKGLLEIFISLTLMIAATLKNVLLAQFSLELLYVRYSLRESVVPVTSLKH